jgi:hypothetical protein
MFLTRREQPSPRCGEALVAIRVAHNATLSVQHHRVALAGGERLPRRQLRVIRIAGAREGDPSATHPVGERLPIAAAADDRLAVL